MNPTYVDPSTAAADCTTPAPCPACGGLECLCRPRFFAGQLLTERELNGLEHYVVERNKLHNRYLQGWGVVCGLEVLCTPCHDGVTVTPGYALSPCGEDIVVCETATVPVCELIARCREQERRDWECEPYKEPARDDCKDVEEQWILTVRYDEKPARGIATLHQPGASACTRCSGGGGCSCGGGNGNGNGTTRSTLTQCEPTLVCEGYRFEVSKVRPGVADRRALSEPAARFQACTKALVDAIPPMPQGEQPTRAELRAWCCAVKLALRDFFETHALDDCDLQASASNLKCPDPADFESDEAYRQAIAQVGAEIAALGGRYLRHCLCSALLPPCPDPVHDPRVPLATITVGRDPCRVRRVCNWDVRRFAPTLTSLRYWLSILPLGTALRERLTTLCCTSTAERGPVLGFAQRQPVARVEAKPSDPATVLRDALERPERTVDAGTLFAAALGATDAKGEPYAGPEELASPEAFLLAHQLAAPVVRGLAPEPKPPPARRTADPAVTQLRRELRAMQKTVREQQARIDELERKS